MRNFIVNYERFTVLKVPFPFADCTVAKNRLVPVLLDTATFNNLVSAGLCYSGHAISAPSVWNYCSVIKKILMC